MSKMTVIQLLNKIANGEEVPKKIKYHSDIYFIDYGNWYRYYDEKENRHDFLNVLYEDFSNLNDTVEILKEEKKIPEKLDEFNIQGLEVSGYSMTQAEYLLEDGVKENREMINWILDYLKSKGE